MKTFSFKVIISNLDDDLDEASVREYITHAVKSYGGAFHPEDPLFGLSYDQIEVVRFVKQQRPRRR
jgi:hypothetical protein